MKFVPTILLFLAILWLNLLSELQCQRTNQFDSSTSSSSDRWREDKIEDEENKIERIKFKRRQTEFGKSIIWVLILLTHFNSLESEQNDDNQFVDKQFASFLSLTKNFERSSEQLNFDGWFHDLNEVNRGAKGRAHIWMHIQCILFYYLLFLGAPLTRLFRSTRSSSNFDLPNVFKLSESILKSYEEPSFSSGGKNLLFVYFGLFALNEVVDAHQPRCPPSYREIQFPKDYFDKNGQEVIYQPTTNHSYIILNKLEYCKTYSYEVNNPPRKINTRTSWIDGETLYGDNKFCADQMRTFTAGHVIEISTLYTKKSAGLQCFNGNVYIYACRNAVTHKLRL